MMKLPDRLLVVEWIDSRGAGSTWIRRSDYEIGLVCNCISVGYVVDETKTTLTLAPHLICDDDYQFCGDITIPKRAIIRKTRLQAPEETGR